MDRRPLDVAELRGRLVTAGGLWRDVTVVPQTGSTNADLLEEARAGADEGLVLVAEEQTAGRGRLGRSWSAPPRCRAHRSPCCSAQRTCHPPGCGWLPLLTGVAVATAVRADNRRAGQPQMAERRAGGGAEAGRDPGRGAWRRGGGRHRAQRHAEPGRAAGADRDLAAHRGRGQHRPGRAAGRRSWPNWPAGTRPGAADPDGAELRADYLRWCATIGREVRAELPGGAVLTGTAADVDDAGRLVLRTPGGLVPVGAGDVVHVR